MNDPQVTNVYLGPQPLIPNENSTHAQILLCSILSICFYVWRHGPECD